MSTKTVPIKHSLTITQLIQNATQKTNSNIAEIIAAHNMTKQEIRKTLHHNKSTQSTDSAPKMEIILNNHNGTRTQSKHLHIQHTESPNITQNILHTIQQTNVNKTNITRLATSNEDEKINISAITESNENAMMPDCKHPIDLG